MRPLTPKEQVLDSLEQSQVYLQELPEHTRDLVYFYVNRAENLVVEFMDEVDPDDVCTANVLFDFASVDDGYLGTPTNFELYNPELH